MIKRLLLLLLCATTLASCVNFRDLSPEEFRTDEFAYKKYEFNDSIKKLAGYLDEYNKNCKPIRGLVINPDNPNFASIVFPTPGIMKTSTIAMIDFKQHGSKTDVTTYSEHHPGWHHIIDNIIEVLNNKGKCSQ